MVACAPKTDRPSRLAFTADIGKWADDWRALCAGADLAGVRGGDGLQGVCFAGRWLPISGNRCDVAGGGRGARVVAAAHGAGAFGTPDLAGRGEALGACAAANA